MRHKYPLSVDKSPPRVPFPYNDYLTAKDKLDQQVVLTSKLEIKAFRGILGDII